MKHTLHLLLSVFGILTAIFLFCVLPQDPTEDPNNSDVSIFIDKNLLLHQGDTPVIGLSLALTRHFQSISVKTSCGAFSTLIAVDTISDYDTVYFKPQFNSVGPCSVFVSAQYKDSKLKDKCDTLLLYILAAEPGIHFVTTPQLVKTGIGKIDTLLYVTKSAGEVTLPPTYSLAVEPQEGITITPVYSQLKDTLRVVISSVLVNTYKLKTIVSVNYNNSQLRDSVTTEVQVSESGILIPSKVDVPKTISIGIADTLLFAIDNSNRSDKLSIKLVTEPLLDPAVFTTLPTGSDSILIKVLSVQAGTAKAGIIVSNGIRVDTTWYSITIGNPSASLWNISEVTVAAIEGKLVKQDLRQYLSKQQTGSVTLAANIGILKDTIWEWTPPFGTDTSVLATVTATKDTISSKLKLAITVSPSDSIKPSLSLIDQTLNGKKVSGSSITVECAASDHESGIGTVKFSYGSSSVDAMWQHDSIYTGIISGLKNGKSTEITVTAIDKSMKKNSKTISFSVTYDSTMVDEEKPAIAYLSGPKNGERVKDSSGVIVYSISDNSGIDSVWWTLNGTYAGTIAKSVDNKYSVNYTLKKYGKNTIVIYALDGSVKKNPGSTEMYLTYNTAPSPVVPEAPANKAVNVSSEPMMSWNGGIDSDGDTVYYKVSYGTAENNLGTQSTELRERSFTVASANKLSASSAIYWQIMAYTKQPYTDTVRSAIVSFTTAGSGPSITTNLPATIKIIEGTTLSLKIVAVSTPSPTFKWYKDDVLLTGQTGAELIKSNVTAGDSGTYYVIVNNGIGTDVVSTKTVVTIRLKAAITQDPVATTVNEGGNGTFTVRAIGEGPLSYQWLKDGVPLPGDTSATYSVTGAKASDDGKKYSCIVTNSLGKDTSVAALLTVTLKPVYLVTFNAGADVTSPEAQQVVEGGKATQPSPPARNGYDFGGWYKESSYTNAWAFTTDLVTGPVTLYAKWIAKSYAITYILNGGTNNVNNPTSYTVVSSIAFVNPSRTGYTFGGWYDNSGLNGTAKSGISSGATGDKTFWAKWIPEDYTITYNLNGGTNNVSNPALYTITSATVTLAAASKPGYTFSGWYENSGLTGTAVTSIPAGSTGDKVFYAKWTITNYTITYNLNNGINNANNPPSYTVTSSTISLAAPNRTGYTFGGWYDNASFTGTAVTSIPAGSVGDKTFWAKWTGDNYAITYILNGGTNGSNPTSYTVASATITLANASRSAYTFGGWYDNPGFSGSAVTTIPSGSTGDKSFYAKWTTIEYPITYVLDGGINHANNPSSYNVTTQTIALATPTKSGYVSSGWFDNPGFSGNQITSIPSGSTGNKTFYVKWEVKDFDGNVYTTVTIGTQVWMVENLKTTHYRNGTAIPELSDQGQWTGDSYGAYCFYDNVASNKSTYGLLYNWYAVNNLSKLAPSGWHVPTAEEWATLTSYLGGDAVAGRALKEAGTTHWAPYPDCPDCEGTNTSGFTALPGGGRYKDGMFLMSIQDNGYWWSATDAGSTTAWCASMSKYSASVTRSSNQINYLMGFSVRCVKD
jgi:uncharacterized protein (TIGR02145 family)/uncharacterized repeat protein (TIGR02543 family)